MSIDILAYGEPLVEFNQQPDDPSRYLQGFGGDTWNFCIAAGRQGATTGTSARWAPTGFGERLLALWTTERGWARQRQRECGGAHGRLLRLARQPRPPLRLPARRFAASR